jgi:uncharacterized protein YfdQ (DUF2303 family)
LCLTLESKSDVSFRSSARLQNGQHQIRFEETITDRAGGGVQQGSFDIPNAFKLAIEPFQGVGLKSIDARFRYRVKDGALAMWYELVRPEDVLKAAFDEIVAQIRSGVSPAPVLAGVAPTIA